MQRSIRFLFLGDITTDRRTKNYIRYFQSRGWRSELLCSTASASALTDLPREFDASIHLLSKTHGPLMFYEHHRSLVRRLETLSPVDVTIANELYSLTAARYAKQHLKATHVAYDAREIYTGLPTVTGKPLARWFWKHVESRGLMASDSVIVTAPLDAGAIQAIHHFLPRSFLIRNLPMQAKKPEKNDYLRKHFSISDDKKILVYLGGIQRDRGLGQMVNAMHALKDECSLVLIGDGELHDGLVSVVRNAGLSDSVYFHKAIPSEQVLDTITSADIGVALVDTDAPSYALALPSKIYEYLFAGLPVLASPMKQAMKEFDGHSALRFVKLHDEKAIIQGVRELISLTKSTDLLSKLQDDAIRSYTFENDAQHFAEFLEERIK